MALFHLERAWARGGAHWTRLCGLGLLVGALAAVRPASAQPSDGPAPHEIRVNGYPVSILYATGGERVAQRVAVICRASLPRLAREIGLDHLGGFRVLLIDDMAAFQARQGVRLPAWGVAFALMDRQVMLVDVPRASNAWNALERVIPHELSHLLVAQRVRHAALPVWFVEGLALWQAREWSLIENWRLMESVWTRRAPALGYIANGLPTDEGRVRDAYRVSYTAITKRFDGEMDRLPEFLDAVAEAGSFSAAFETFWHEGESVWYADFDRALERKYRSRLLFFQTGPLFSVLAVVFLFVYLRIWLRSRRKMKQLEAGERGAWGDGEWRRRR